MVCIIYWIVTFFQSSIRVPHPIFLPLDGRNWHFTIWEYSEHIALVYWLTPVWAGLCRAVSPLTRPRLRLQISPNLRTELLVIQHPAPAQSGTIHRHILNITIIATSNVCHWHQVRQSAVMTHCVGLAPLLTADVRVTCRDMQCCRQTNNVSCVMQWLIIWSS